MKKHTKREWHPVEFAGIWMILDADGEDILSEDNVGKIQAEDNAKLIVEAGTVANETGKTPRQLADENKELLGALIELKKDIEADDYNYRIATISKVNNAIKKATE